MYPSVTSSASRWSFRTIVLGQVSPAIGHIFRRYLIGRREYQRAAAIDRQVSGTTHSTILFYTDQSVNLGNFGFRADQPIVLFYRYCSPRTSANRTRMIGSPPNRPRMGDLSSAAVWLVGHWTDDLRRVQLHCRFSPTRQRHPALTWRRLAVLLAKARSPRQAETTHPGLVHQRALRLVRTWTARR